jgi:hypothetical protein
MSKLPKLQRSKMTQRSVNTVKGAVDFEKVFFDCCYWSELKPLQPLILQISPEQLAEFNSYTKWCEQLLSDYWLAQDATRIKSKPNFFKITRWISTEENQILTARTRERTVRPYNHISKFSNPFLLVCLDLEKLLWGRRGAETPLA